MSIDIQKLKEALCEHLHIEVEAKTDYDTFGSSTDVHVRLLWVERDSKGVMHETELTEDSDYVCRESRG